MENLMKALFKKNCKEVPFSHSQDSELASYDLNFITLIKFLKS